MSDIPTDILREVFRQCSSSPLQAHSAWKFPWYLGQVCSHWRTLFFSMRSTFWNKIVIEGMFSRAKTANVQEIIAFFIDCTHGQPFSFTFCMGDRSGVRLHGVLADLCAHSEQWEEASIRLLSSELEHLCSVKGRLPGLKKLEIVVAWSMKHERMRSTIAGMATNVFEDAPLLTHVGLRDDHTWQFNFNWSSLTIVNFLCLEYSESILAILRETTNLVELTLVCSLGKHLNIEGGGLIHLPRLEHLCVDWAPLLTALETPSLQQLNMMITIAVWLAQHWASSADRKSNSILFSFSRRWQRRSRRSCDVCPRLTD